MSPSSATSRGNVAVTIVGGAAGFRLVFAENSVSTTRTTLELRAFRPSTSTASVSLGPRAQSNPAV